MEDVLPAVGPGHVLFVLWETKMSEYTETDLMYDLEAMVREEAEHELRSLIIELSSPHYPPPVREAAQSGDADTALERLREWLAAREAMVREEAELRSLIIELSSPQYPPPVREAAQSGDADTALERLREWLAAGGDTASDPRDGQDVVAGLVAESVARHDQ
jgi:hypothetical protein